LLILVAHRLALVGLLTLDRRQPAELAKCGASRRLGEQSVGSSDGQPLVATLLGKQAGQNIAVIDANSYRLGAAISPHGKVIGVHPALLNNRSTRESLAEHCGNVPVTLLVRDHPRPNRNLSRNLHQIIDLLRSVGHNLYSSAATQRILVWPTKYRASIRRGRRTSCPYLAWGAPP